jgi:hypothetical protein
MIDPINAISIASSGITVITSPDYLLDSLTAGYVLLTLALAIIAFRSLSKTQSSLDLTRQQIELNKQQSQEASAASERHLQATIDAVNKQIAASEAQSQAAIEAVNKQIAVSERQAQEALYNQRKPLIIWHTPTAESASAKRPSSAHDVHIYDLDIENVGTGIATNVWSVLCMAGSQNQPHYVCTYSCVLVPNKKEGATFYQGTEKFSSDVIEGYSFYPQEQGVQFRVVTTYLDIFNRKHVSIFDCEGGYHWKQIRFLSDIGKTLEEMRV